MRKYLFFVAIVFAFSCKQQADVVYIHAKIWTGDSSQPAASVLAIKNGVIVYVGDDAAAVTASSTVDVEGKLLLPGFTDNHTHFLSAGYGLSSVKLKDAMTRQEFIARIAAFCARKPHQTWVMEGGWDHENWEENSSSRVDRFCNRRPSRVHLPLRWPHGICKQQGYGTSRSVCIYSCS